jgi:ArsR family transcriptional regulator
MKLAMLKERTKIFKALSDPNRIRILKMLQAKHLCVCEISSVLNLAASTVSKHLSILRESGFIIDTKDGKWVNFRINPSPSDQRVSAILSSLDFWMDNDDVIAADKEKIKTVNRHDICST